MTKLRQTIARRLKDAQNTAAMLTTFNDVDMGAVMELRNQYKDVFEKKHGVKLGFMGFFIKACVQALKDIPAVNAEIDGQDIVYKNYYHIGIAVGTDKGLVVPVVRDADQLSLAGIEKTIAEFGKRARDGKLTIEDMQGGTFTITNGGIYGSLMSTPILNAPQSGILGMHRIEERPVVRDGKIVAAADDVPRPVLRSPHRRRQGGRDLPGAGQGSAGGPGAAGAGSLSVRPSDDFRSRHVPAQRRRPAPMPRSDPSCRRVRRAVASVIGGALTRFYRPYVGGASNGPRLLMRRAMHLARCEAMLASPGEAAGTQCSLQAVGYAPRISVRTSRRLVSIRQPARCQE